MITMRYCLPAGTPEIPLICSNSINYRIICWWESWKRDNPKIVLFPLRLVSLFFFILKHKPDIAVSQSSFYQPLVAKLLRIPCLYTNDNEHAKGNLFGFFSPTKLSYPWHCKIWNLRSVFRLKSKVSFYPSVRRQYISHSFHDLQSLAAGPKSKIYFRPEPWSAQYYKGPFNFFDDILLKLIQRI